MSLDLSDYVVNKGDPYNPPREGKCPIDDLPDELLSYIFQLGVENEQEGWDEDSDEDEYDDPDSDGSTDDGSTDDEASDGSSVNSSDLSLNRASSIVTTSLLEDDQVGHLPFQVLVSHVCRRWRSVALDTHRFWTMLTFSGHPRLAQAKEYILRSSSLPLIIELDCGTDDGGDDDDQLSDISQEEKNTLSLEELEQILDLLESAISHWGTFIFYANRYDYVHVLMSRLQNLAGAPCLKSFQVHIHGDWEDSVVPDEDKTRYLPFQGRAPNLKEAIFWGVHIDWEAASPDFLRGLRDLALSYLTKDVRPTYAAFAEIIRHSPELRTLTLSLAGPILADGVAFDSEEAWGPIPLSIPSLTELVLQFHDPKYASALVQHLDLPNVTSLLLDFDDEDYSDFVQTLAKPSKGRDRSLLQQIIHLKISALPCDVASVEILLSQLISLKSLNLKLYGVEEGTIYEKLVDPWAMRIGPASSSTALSPRVDIPKVFCPKLEEFIATGLNGSSVKTLIIARRDAGVPLKKIKISEEDELLTDDELWMKNNVEELSFFDPSDSEDEIENDVQLFPTLD